MSLNAKWLGIASEFADSCGARLADGWRHLSEPRRAARLRLLLCALACLWLILSLSRALWLLLPAPVAAALPEVANPLAASAPVAAAPVDIERLAGWNPFGVAAPAAPAERADASAAELPAAELLGEDARETSLDLKLQGVIASSEPDDAVAVIEHAGRQQPYRAGDRLPMADNVTLARVLPGRAVLDNGGTYEVLKLFEEEGPPSVSPVAGEPPATSIDRRGDADVSELARQYRQRLYRDPQSLANVVRVAAVRQDGELRGYRLSPGNDRDQFERLGFRPGDLVTGVNGIALTDPARAMELYRVMREAQEADFDIQRGGESMNLVVSFGNVDGR